jgi:hypothetical protein
MGAREDREADHVDSLLQRGGGDLRGGQADALVDDVHAHVARAHRDLLGAVGMAVEAGLADQDLRAAAEPLSELRHLPAQLRELPRRAAAVGVLERLAAGLADAGGGAVAAEDVAQGACPLARRRARARRRDRGEHQVLLRTARRARERAQSLIHSRLIAL